jgi:hypothetical protein
MLDGPDGTEGDAATVGAARGVVATRSSPGAPWTAVETDRETEHQTNPWV